MSNSYQEMLLQMAEQDRLETEAYEALQAKLNWITLKPYAARAFAQE